MHNGRYAQLKGDTIEKLIPRPRWFTDDGELASDEVLAQHGVVPAIETPPALEPGQRAVVKPLAAWLVFADRVEATYDVASIPFAELQAAALARINAEYTARTSALASDYPEDEQKSWPVQIQEAQIVLDGGDTPTPWIDNAAATRGVTREDLAALIQAQDVAYRTYHGTLTGIRQALRDQVYAVPDDESAAVALQAITWPEGDESENEQPA